MGNSAKRAQQFAAQKAAQKAIMTVSTSMDKGSSLIITGTKYAAMARDIASDVVAQHSTAQNARHVYARSIPAFCGMVKSYDKNHARVADGSKLIGEPMLFDESGQETSDVSGKPAWMPDVARWTKTVKAYDAAIIAHELPQDEHGVYAFPVYDLVSSPIAYAIGVLHGDLGLTLSCASQFESLKNHDRMLLQAMALALPKVTAVYAAVVAMSKAIKAVANMRDTVKAERKQELESARDEAINQFVALWADMHLITLDSTDLGLAVENVQSGNMGMAMVSASNAIKGTHAAYVAKMVANRNYRMPEAAQEPASQPQAPSEAIVNESQALSPSAMDRARSEAICYACLLQEPSESNSAIYLASENTPFCQKHYAQLDKHDRKACAKIIR